MKYPDSQLEQKLMKLVTFLFFIFVFLTFTGPVLDPDTPWHLKTGEYIFMNNTIPASDPFSFADDSLPFIGKFILTQNWLAQVLLFLVYKYGGAFGLVLLRATIFTSLSALLRYLIRDKGFYLSFLITGAFVYFLHDFQGIRPQLFTFLFSGIVIYLFEKFKEEGNTGFLFPLIFLMLLWANMHGGYIYGVVLLLIYMISECIQFYVGSNYAATSAEKISWNKLYWMLGVCCFAIMASLANPNSYKAFLYTFTSHAQDIYSNILEYKSPFQLMKIGLFKLTLGFWFYSIASAIMLSVFIKRRDITSLLLLLFSVLPAMVSIRYLPLFMIVATSMFRNIPGRFSPEINSRIRYGLHVVLIIASLSLMLSYNPLKNKNIFKFNDSDFYAVRASDFLMKNNISGNIFASYSKASFLLFSLFPDSRVYIDTRFLSEKRIQISEDIEGFYEPAADTLKEISRLIPDNIGTIQVSDVKAATNEKSDGNDLPSNGAGSKSRDWKDLLDDIKADIIVHEAVNKYSGDIYPFIFKLVRDDSWKLVYADGNVMVFVRDIQKYNNIILKYNKPKSLVYDEILHESLRGINTALPGFHTSAALALLLKGFADTKANTLIETALALAPNDVLANYCKTLYILMDHAKKQGAHQ